MIRWLCHRGVKRGSFVLQALRFDPVHFRFQKEPGLVASQLPPCPDLALLDPRIQRGPRNVQQTAGFLGADDIFWSHDGYLTHTLFCRPTAAARVIAGQHKRMVRLSALQIKL